jgi:hypothetical protein
MSVSKETIERKLREQLSLQQVMQQKGPISFEEAQEREIARREAIAEADRKILEKEQVKRDKEQAEREAARKARLEMYREQDEAREKERQEAREARQKELSKAREEELKATLKAAYMQTPGATEAGFRSVYPDLLRQVQVEETLKALEDPLASLRPEFDRRFASNRHVAPPSRSRVIPEPVPVELES